MGERGRFVFFFSEFLIGICFALYAIYNTYSLEKRQRSVFRDAALSSAFNEAAENELGLLSGMLAMLMPSALVPVALAKTTGQQDGIIDSLGEVCAGSVRLEGLTGGGILSTHSGDGSSPVRVMELVEALYETVGAPWPELTSRPGRKSRLGCSRKSQPSGTKS